MGIGDIRGLRARLRRAFGGQGSELRHPRLFHHQGTMTRRSEHDEGLAT